MEKNTLFWFTLPNGEEQQVLFKGDHVASGNLYEGQSVRMLLKPNGHWDVEIGRSGRDDGYCCTVVALWSDSLAADPVRGTPEFDVWVLQLALEGASAVKH